PKFIAIGEIGLDYHYDKEHKDEQIELFKKQLRLAEELNLPVVVHNRESTKDMVDTLKEFDLKGIVHCFSGSIETAEDLIKMGYHIGVGGVMTFKNSKVDEVIKNIPIENLTLETDAPYLTPEPFRGKQNKSKYIKDIAEYLADIKNITLEEVMKKTEENVQDIFDF
ncbi:MAG: TatD family hydrolase, partial [Bacilli bacterium]|nr:TatD family hydrolase [Bacilli bacterium]